MNNISISNHFLGRELFGTHTKCTIRSLKVVLFFTSNNQEEIRTIRAELINHDCPKVATSTLGWRMAAAIRR